MADTRLRIRSEVLPIRIEAGDLVIPEQVGSRVENMYATSDGTLESVWGPLPYVPTYSDGSGATYAVQYGIFHATLGDDGSRDVLLTQDGDKIRVFEGWNAGPATGNIWRALISPPGQPSQIDGSIGADDKPRFPCQFESTPDGIVIIPSGETSRPYFYDGRIILPLGYSSAPGAPRGHGPVSVGTARYAQPGAINGTANSGSQAGYARLGTVSATSVGDNMEGRIAQGYWQTAYQWVDVWGNLSPMSGRSEAIEIPLSEAKGSGGGSSIANFRYLLYWEGIEPGPQGTVGRILCRTKDMLSSGTADLFRVPAGIVGQSPINGAFPALAISLGTIPIPDNVSTSFPDNIPDSTLIRKPKEPVPVTPFKLYTLAFGRGWAANFSEDPGKLHPSVPGKWGTFLENEEIYPDPRGAAITGMIQVPEGLLVFTATSTFMIVISYSGDGFQTKTIHPRAGCVAPSSVAMTPQGVAIWLGREGFYAYAEEKIQLISQPIQREVSRFNDDRTIQAVAAVDTKTRKYRCWVPMNGSRRNNVCWEFDGEGWNRRTDVQASAVCVTQDHRAYMIAAGRATVSGGSPAEGVWLLDHQVQSWTPSPRASIVQTAWLRVMRSEGRGSPLTVYLWLRETGSGNLTIEVERDWRAEVVQTCTAKLYPADDTPPFWDTARWGGTSPSGDALTWKRRRPYWTRVDIHVPSAEVFRLKITNTVQWEFLGLAFDEVPKTDTFRSAPK